MVGPPLPSRLARPGPVRAPRPPETQSNGYPADHVISTRLCNMMDTGETPTESAQPSRSNELHQLVVAHVSQQALQAAFS